MRDTRLKALELGVQGHAKNLPTVELKCLLAGNRTNRQFVMVVQGSPVRT